MTSHGYETRAATARKADGESAGNATTPKMAVDKLATPAAARVMAREFGSLQEVYSNCHDRNNSELGVAKTIVVTFWSRERSL